ncbi:hypothetical protein BGW37DRAFT_493288 [Umbelopsis sp. PMI_123]|nr:hypothetical protein BGW37DRAFT_493288 [Umbelopsis sp. PMI_123]
MASINDIQFKTIKLNSKEGDRKVPVPLPNEGFFFHSGRLRFTIKTNSRKYASRVPGFVYLTSLRLVLLAKEPIDSFESFQICFEEVVSLKAKLTVSPHVSAFVCNTINESGVQVELDFRESSHCQTFRDYMKMIVVTAAAQNLGPPETGLMEATRIEYVELPPSYNSVAAGVSDPILDENPSNTSLTRHTQTLPSYSSSM